jgi:hypothetical protein
VGGARCETDRSSDGGTEVPVGMFCILDGLGGPGGGGALRTSP